MKKWEHCYKKIESVSRKMTQSQSLCHVSDIATRVNRKLKWNPVKEQFMGDKEANKRLELRTMREPWQLT